MNGAGCLVRSRAVLAMTGAAVLLASCSGASSPPATAGASTPSSATAPGGSASPTSATTDRLTSQILGTTQDPASIAAVDGTLLVLSAKVPAVAEILEVRAGRKSTLLRWRLKSASGSQVSARGSSLSRPPLFDTRAVSLRDVAGAAVLSPFTYVPQRGENDTGCVCSAVPAGLGADAEPMYALYPPLDPAATTVDVVLPGFAVAKGVAVTRP